MRPSSRTTKEDAQVEIDARAVQAVHRGHPWVWKSAIRRAPTSAECGAVVRVISQDGTPVGRGLWDPASPLAVRLYTHDPSQPLDLSWLTTLLARAVQARANRFHDADTNAYRLCNGEGDRLPGVVLDRYGPAAIARFDSDAIRLWGKALMESVWPHLRELGIRSLSLREHKKGQPVITPLTGEPMPNTVVVVERGMRMLVDLAHGQKTGAFLDQRENRYRIRAMSAGARVLNLFSYAGGFSCAAALGGASHVTSVDIAHPAHAIAQETFRLNGLDASAHTFVTSDVFAYLEQAYQRKERFNLVISDPPSFAPNERSLPRALTAYKRLHEACARVVARGGILCASSCSSHVNLEDFLSTLDNNVLGQRGFVVSEAFGNPSDHPTPAEFPEGRYLKFVILNEPQAPLAQHAPLF